ncbi:MAG: type II toxin-antitoxin system mRNA interferase toxin, RelE/StbE family [Patescibacteria group bacterium]|nr:type II toxin-antitoxin system mRNA interferase toxin, RelE/StbE family [Patescibacteria group bacterium]
MIVGSSKKFDKAFKKCPQEIKDRFIERLEIFKSDKYDPILKNHSLSGKLNGLRSINVSGNYRAIFEEKSDDIIFIAIGTHSQLYK